MGVFHSHDYACYLGKSNITWLLLPVSMEGKAKLIDFQMSCNTNNFYFECRLNLNFGESKVFAGVPL